MHSTRPCALGAAQRLGAGVSSLRARAPPRVSSFGGRRPPSTEARLRPGRQGVRSDGYDDWYGPCSQMEATFKTTAVNTDFFDQRGAFMQVS